MATRDFQKDYQNVLLRQIVMPGSVSRDSPAYKAALDEITAAWKSSFAYQPAAGG